jgi:hydrogenase/urease accessory protein HupE
MSAFVGGLLHPLAVPAHALALLALGLLIGQQRAARLVVPVAAFATGLAAGLAALAFGVGQTSAANVLLVAAAVSGLLVALARPLPVLAGAPLAAIVGVAAGLDSPPNVISISAATMMLIGTGVGATVAFVVVVLCARHAADARHIAPRTGVRILGSWAAASAVLVLALRFARGQLF